MEKEKINLFEGLNLRNESIEPSSSEAEMHDVDKVYSLNEQIRERYSQDTRFRKHLARWVMWIVPAWLAIVLIIVFFCGFGLTSLDSSVLITLLATTTVNVLGLAYIVLKGIFRQNT